MVNNAMSFTLQIFYKSRTIMEFEKIKAQCESLKEEVVSWKTLLDKVDEVNWNEV